MNCDQIYSRPAHRRMATFAHRTQLGLMDIKMAGITIPLCEREILQLVTVTALHADMLTLEMISGYLVIKLNVAPALLRMTNLAIEIQNPVRVFLRWNRFK
jgi:hypothetical protein